MSATFGVNWHHPVPGGNINISADDYYSAKYYYDAANQLEQNTFTKLNARMRYSHDRSNIEVSIFGSNLENSEYYIYQFQTDFGVVGKLAQPVSYGVALSWRYGE